MKFSKIEVYPLEIRRTEPLLGRVTVEFARLFYPSGVRFDGCQKMEGRIQ